MYALTLKSMRKEQHELTKVDCGFVGAFAWQLHFHQCSKLGSKARKVVALVYDLTSAQSFSNLDVGV